ncbi:class I SAM-dependent methyltransferase [Nocardia asteroides]|uniref:class I SAM-dependent methyltransferase n=1 Tax=Nocardia asteroides TaxID=1824 RepID=UPI001E52980E|nr:class I SAM-dependent methyltransferase [Nocardia asteroides]UGT61063.1 class I SAM-dependent methyltransferase [Nocardia asteroides]
MAERTPTSHERTTGLPWDASYRDGPAPWDFGGPQPAVVRRAVTFTGPILDAGCGSGENALFLAGRGLEVFGVDVAETALALARERAAERGLTAEFATADALRLDELGRTFPEVLDCGLLHTFDAAEKRAYATSLAAVTERTLFLLCFADEGDDPGPHPVSRAELAAAFGESAGWRITAVEPDRIMTRFHANGAAAWFATIRRE